MTFRHFVLVEPFGPNDFSIFAERDERAAIDCERKFREDGKQTKFITGSGTMSDIRQDLKRQRARYVSELAAALNDR